jgi:hypothetical protein
MLYKLLLGAAVMVALAFLLFAFNLVNGGFDDGYDEHDYDEDYWGDE